MGPKCPPNVFASIAGVGFQIFYQIKNKKYTTKKFVKNSNYPLELSLRTIQIICA